MNEQQMRADFEAWASDEGMWPKAVERSGESYKLMQTASAWIVWQAALRASGGGSTLPATTEQAYAMAQVCLDLHEALGVKWGDNPYLAIEQLKGAISEAALPWQVTYEGRLIAAFSDESDARGYYANGDGDSLRSLDVTVTP